ncbi:GntR family transcriptional regulator [Paenibacillus physcomitrellae]|nr:GntR family transcriptional regulator [Paenibacillus physcomitrellae]
MGSRISRMNVTEEIYRIVKEDILTHKLPAGEKVNIDQLARTLEVSNIPIREALSRLQSEGYLHMVPFKGMFVNLMSLQQLDEIFEIRLQLEPFAAGKAALIIPDGKLAQLSSALDSIRANETARTNDGLQMITEMNDSIHGTILKYCDNHSLRTLVNGYLEQTQRYLTFIELTLDVDDREVEWAEHHAILQQLIQRNVNGASAAMFDHISKARRRANVHFRNTGG